MGKGLPLWYCGLLGAADGFMGSLTKSTELCYHDKIKAGG